MGLNETNDKHTLYLFDRRLWLPQFELATIRYYNRCLRSVLGIYGYLRYAFYYIFKAPDHLSKDDVFT